MARYYAVAVPESTYAALRRLRQDTGRTIIHMVREALELFIAQQDAPDADESKELHVLKGWELVETPIGEALDGGGEVDA